MTTQTVLTLLLMLLVSGVFAGLIAGLLGVGGGIILVPVMTLLLSIMQVSDEVAMHMAVATSLAVIIATATTSARAHNKRAAIDWHYIKRWMPAMAIGALSGALIARFMSGDVLRVMFAALALIVGATFIRGARKKQTSTATHIAPAGQAGIAVLIGTLSAWLGIGGGSLSVPTLQAAGLPLHKAVGTSALLGLAIAIPGALGFLIAGQGIAGRPPGSVGYVYFPAAAALAVTAALFAPLGAKLAHFLNQTRLRQVFGIFLLIAGSNMVFKTLA